MSVVIRVSHPGNNSKDGDNMSSGFHRSKEVYKFTETPTGRKLVPIRGLYVSGLHTEPRYTDHLITVKNFTSSTTNVVNFTEVSRDVYTPCMQGVGFGNVDPTIINHPISKVSMIPDHLVKVKDFTSSTTVVTNVNTV
jgi:hypothetical protein